jgi:transposase
VSAFPKLTTRSALTILAAAPTPAMARELSPDQIRQLLRAAGRVGVRASEVERLHRTFGAEQLRQPAAVEDAMGEAVRAIVTTLTATQTAIANLEAALATRFDNHPDAEILRSLPGLGVVLGGRVLGEFGDDPTRFTDAASRRRYAGTAPVTKASGKSRVVLLRRARNQRLAEACRWWAFNAILHSEGTMAYYRRRRAAGDTHEAALRRLGSKLVGQLHHCLEHREPYQEDIAWPTPAVDPPSSQPSSQPGQPTAA